jgi:hypothetical protein
MEPDFKPVRFACLSAGGRIVNQVVISQCGLNFAAGHRMTSQFADLAKNPGNPTRIVSPFHSLDKLRFGA